MKDNFENNCLLIAVVLTIATCLYLEWSNPCAAWVDQPCEYTGESNG
jgi:hypothetical protein